MAGFFITIINILLIKIVRNMAISKHVATRSLADIVQKVC